MAAVLTDELRRQALELIRAGQGRNAVARTTGLTTNQVTRVAHDAGLSFDRSATAVAVKARSLDLAERRSQLEADYLQDAQKLRTLLWRPYIYRELGRFSEPDGDGSRSWSEFVEYTQDTPTPQDQLRLTQASVQAARQSQAIADAGAGAKADQAKSMLAALFEGLGQAWRDVQEGEAADGA